MRLVCLTLTIALAACSSSKTNTAAGNLSGTLYFDNGIDYQVHKIDLSSGVHTKIGSGQSPQVTPQGTLLLVDEGNLAEAPVTLETYRHIDDLTTGSDVFAEGFSFPRLSPDGTKVAYLSDGGKIVVVDRQAGTRLAVITDTSKYILGFSRPSWTPDGRLVFADELGSGGILMSDAAFSINLTRIDPQLSDVSDAMVSHDGKHVAFVKTSQVWIMGIDGTGAVKLDTNAAATDALPYWSPDDSVVYWHAYAGDVQFHAADGTGDNVALYTLFPALSNDLTIIPSTGGMDWVN